MLNSLQQRKTITILIASWLGAIFLFSCLLLGVVGWSVFFGPPPTHADRVFDMAEMMHSVGVRAEPRSTIEQQRKVVAAGTRHLKVPRQKGFVCEWRLSAYDDGRSFMRVDIEKAWSRDTANTAWAQFSRFAGPLPNPVRQEVKRMVAAVKPGDSQESEIADYRLEVMAEDFSLEFGGPGSRVIIVFRPLHPFPAPRAK